LTFSSNPSILLILLLYGRGELVVCHPYGLV
jgi:hypothetical protein